MTTTIILSAFQGRLRSAPIEWPETVQDIILPMSQDMRGGWFALGMDANPQAMTVRKARFMATDKHELLPNGQYARIYEMVDC